MKLKYDSKRVTGHIFLCVYSIGLAIEISFCTPRFKTGDTRRHIMLTRITYVTTLYAHKNMRIQKHDKK